MTLPSPSSARSNAAPALVRVTYRMTDQMGVVYYGNYLELFEIGRAELMRQAGLDYRAMERDGYLLAATHAVCDYLQPALYDDLLEIETRVDRLTRVRVHFRYEIRRGGEGRPLARGATHHAYLGRDGRPRRLSPEWWEALTRLAGPAAPESGDEKSAAKGTP